MHNLLKDLAICNRSIVESGCINQNSVADTMGAGISHSTYFLSCSMTGTHIESSKHAVDELGTFSRGEIADMHVNCAFPCASRAHDTGSTY